jgi:DNA-binding CsgD family transcriptional regulator
VESLLPAFALQFAWNSDFASAERVLAGTAETMGTLAHATLRHAEIALYAAASNDRETAENSIKSCQEGLLRLEDSPESITPRVVRSRLWFAMASLILGRPALANNALREVEREGRRITPAMRALGVLVRATFVHVETGSGHSEMAAALEGVREAGLGGYARVIEQLPLPTVSSSPRFASLTKTEVKVLCSLAVGGSSKSIGSELGRSSQTIDSHVKAIIRKLGCRGRQEAVSLAREHGIV